MYRILWPADPVGAGRGKKGSRKASTSKHSPAKSSPKKSSPTKSSTSKASPAKASKSSPTKRTPGTPNARLKKPDIDEDFSVYIGGKLIDWHKIKTFIDKMETRSRNNAAQSQSTIDYALLLHPAWDKHYMIPKILTAVVTKAKREMAAGEE